MKRILLLSGILLFSSTLLAQRNAFAPDTIIVDSDVVRPAAQFFSFTSNTVPSIRHTVEAVPNSALGTFRVRATVQNPQELASMRVFFELPPTATLVNCEQCDYELNASGRTLSMRVDEPPVQPTEFQVIYTLSYDWQTANSASAGVAAWIEYAPATGGRFVLNKTQRYKVPIYRPKGVVVRWTEPSPQSK